MSASSLRTASPVSDAVLHSLSPSNAAAIQRLRATASSPSDVFDRLSHKAQAAVAIFLYEQPYSSGAPLDWFPPNSRPNLGAPPSSSGGGSSDGDEERVLHVVMTTRALHLRSHPGQASLPGGKREQSDSSIEHTALRESTEEVNMSGWKSVRKEVHWLHTAPPLLSKTCLLVHPVVFFLSNPSKTLSTLRANPSEVSALWSVPLPLFLASSQTHCLLPQGYTLSDPAKVDTHRPPQDALRTYSDVPWLLGSPYRLHRFRSSQQLVKGLTADILIGVASGAYGMAPRFEVRAPGQMGWDRMVEVVLARLKEGRRGESRWGDGESGDAQGSTEAFDTIVGVDLRAEGEEEEVILDQDQDQQKGGNAEALAASLQSNGEVQPSA
ncbi:unnamed protein product [Tilletia laevis]|uniref:Nudix hydrolase domain-containing protein n=4 Tax=Tilletia TaxID=13289 RepID=A0A8X7SZ62_9BASI|nr:hypothetical protein CF336_g1341 [Tilletia laevis]KAE8203808.1 hypothetical protein CF328_g1436 [Tilletia controversa]KAE8264364.1 hypothetical protein A4X03_0g1005 [Tilletia caries]KAE8207894.1 hypothetical protein CF335_g814 [Tilletia laevis]KAE8253222.1 hypothetical protein A4X06_0g1609 [Tilletia controversa]